MTFVALQNSATLSVAHHTMRLVAAASVALFAFFGAGGKDDVQHLAQSQQQIEQQP